MARVVARLVDVEGDGTAAAREAVGGRWRRLGGVFHCAVVVVVV